MTSRSASCALLIALLAAGPLAARPAAKAAAPRTIFVTSLSGDGNLAGWNLPAGAPPIPSNLDGAEVGDFICFALALDAGLPDAASYRAWLSDFDDDAFCRIQGLRGRKADNCGQESLPAAAGPWARVDGLLFASSLLAIASGSPSVVTSPAALNEHGVLLGHLGIWTGTLATGEASGNPCLNWETSSSLVGAASGSTRRTLDHWTRRREASCDEEGQLLCMQAGGGPPPPSPARGGRFAFVTSTAFSGNLGSAPEAAGETGIAAGDAICRARATAGGLAFADSFKAWLSDDATNAKDRFTSGPWIRLDGFPLAGSIKDLTDGTIRTAIDRDELAEPISPALPFVFTGTLSSGERAAANCSDWDDAGAAVTIGLALGTSAEWSASGTALSGCSAPARLYCFSDADPRLLFADGFESGATRLWTAVRP